MKSVDGRINFKGVRGAVNMQNNAIGNVIAIRDGFFIF